MKSTPASDPAPASLGAALRWATDRLRAAGSPQPRREAVDIWSRVTEADPGLAVAASERPLGDDEWRDLARAVAARAAGSPTAYATALAGFRGLDLTVGPAVLIPRPETEGLVQRVLDWAEVEGRRGMAADIGTGSGCIALSLAAEGSFARILATDLSDEILAVARENLHRVRPGTPVELRRGEFFEPLAGESLDAIVANPPYVAPEEYEALDPAVRLHEPRGALVSGEGGMWHTRRLLEGAARCLAPGGLLALEIDARRADQALDAAERYGWEARIEEDVFGRPRYLLAGVRDR